LAPVTPFPERQAMPADGTGVFPFRVPRRSGTLLSLQPEDLRGHLLIVLLFKHGTSRSSSVELSFKSPLVSNQKCLLIFLQSHALSQPSDRVPLD
jgi:hypothetical protein